MHTALRATSKTLAKLLQERLEVDLAAQFVTGSKVVSLATPEEMTDGNRQGLSVWLYAVIRDPEQLNAPPARTGPGRRRRPPLPLRAHYLMTPLVVNTGTPDPSETEHEILGVVLQTFHDHPVLRGPDLQDTLRGTDAELFVRLEQLSLESITRMWESLQRSYQLSVSYEVSVVHIDSRRQPEDLSPVTTAIPEYGLMTAPGSP
jgi:hypothetical protein